MRLECLILGQPLKGKQKPAKPAKAVISIGTGKKLKGEHCPASLSVSTSTKRNQPPIELSATNITCLITSHAVAGKITIEFAQPPWRMFISGADPNRLAKFVQYLRKIKNGEDPGKLEEIKQVKSTELQQQTKLIIDKSKSYYSDYAKNFPTTLQTLSITNCDLSKLDVRWFSNTKLTHLCLADNKLASVDGGLKKLVLIKRLIHLQRLDLSNNMISHLPEDIQWPESLIEICLRNNTLNYIPQSICKLRSLVFLDVSLNPIRSLPKTQCWPRLKKLYFNGTWISYMPFYFTRMKLDELRCSNRIASDEDYWNFNSDVEYGSLSMPTLESIAAAVVRQSKQNEKILPWTVNMNSLTKQCCQCLKYKPSFFIIGHLALKNPMLVANSVDTTGDIPVLIEKCVVCLRSGRL